MRKSQYQGLRFPAICISSASSQMMSFYEANMLRVIPFGNMFERAVTFCLLVRWALPVVLRERYVVLCAGRKHHNILNTKWTGLEIFCKY